MKKKLLSIFLSLSLIFSSIASMSVSFAEENSSTEKVVQQDGIEVRMDMKAGSSIFMAQKHWLTNPNPSWKEYFEDNANNKKAELLNYNGNQLMKIVIEIPKKEGLVINNINHEQNDAVPDNIKQNFPKYFGWKENDKGNNQYNFYFRDYEDKNYNFNIEYTYNGENKQIELSYYVKDLLYMDMNLRAELIRNAFDLNSSIKYEYDEKYLTKTFLGDESKWFNGILIGDSDNNIKKVEDKITSLNGIQYMGNNLRQLELSFYDDKSNNHEKGFVNLEKDGIKPVSLGYYPNLTMFRVSETGKLKPYIPTDSYSPELIAECVRKMPNLIEFTCSGSGFKDFTAFENLKNLNLVEAHLNGIESLEGIENNTQLGTLGVQKNSISDLTPLKECKDLEYFTGYNQSVQKKDPILATKTENKIKIELPIPIDIDGNLTEVGKIVPPSTSVTEKNIVKATYNSKDINYTAFEENRKVYIELNKSDFDNKAEEILDDIKFEFNFHNCNGKDDRTKDKFNGVVNFKATFNPPVEEYRVLYEFVSGTRDKVLPGEVTDLLPVDSNKYLEGQKITAIQPEKLVVNVRDGEWTFDGYDRDEKIANKNNADENINVKFIGTWNFHKREEEKEKGTVVYKFENRSDKYTDSDVDKNVIEVEKLKIPERFVLPVDNTEYDIDREINPKNPTDKNNNKIEVGKEIVVKDEELNTYIGWTFEGYEPKKLSIKPGVNEFIGIWKAKDIEIVDYEFKSDSDKKLPPELDELVKPEKHYDGEEHIKPKDLKDTDIEVSDGVWRFIAWDKKEITEIHHDEHFIGVWHFEPKSTGGGTGGGGTITPTPNPNPTPDKEDPDRVEGDDRIETSIEASEILYPNGTNAVVLANAERFSDVLTANPFAVQEKASALLTYKDKLPEKTLKEIERLGAKKIYVSGGYEAVSKKVVDSLAAKGYEIYRFDGLDRYDTARKIAIKIREKGNKEVVELASGENYPDALCMTSMAVKDNAPILLTKKDSIPKYTKQALAEWDIENVKIGGLDEAISKDVQNQIDKGFEITKGNKADSNIYDGAKKVSRFGGKDRYETSTIIAANSYPNSKLGVYATGEDFPDALIAGNYAGTKEAPVLLVKGDSLPEPIEKYTKESKIKKATIIGGVNAVSDKVFNLIKAIINR